MLDSGADVEVHDKDDKTPLVWAVLNGGDKCVDVLLKGGADVNKKGDRFSFLTFVFKIMIF